MAEVKLRLKPRLHRRLVRTAALSGDSMNAEIVKRLERTYNEDAILELVKSAIWGRMER